MNVENSMVSDHAGPPLGIHRMLVGLVVSLLALICAATPGRAMPMGPLVRGAEATTEIDVAAAIEDRVVGLSSTTGEVTRVLAVAPKGRAVGSVSVTPNGQVIYYTVGEQCGPTPEVWQVPVSGAQEPERVVTAGSGPIVSPDGRLLAYTAVSPSATLRGCVDYDTLVVRNLRTSRERRLELGDQLTYVGALAWMPDSERVVVTRGPGAVVVEVTGGALRVGDPITLRGNGLGFLGTGAAVTSTPGLESTRVVEIELPTGEERFTLFEVPAALALIDVGRFGGGFLFLGPLAGSTEGWDLYTATVTNPNPLLLASHVQSAAWLPPHAPAPAGPERIVVEDVALQPGDALGVGFHPTPRPARLVVEPSSADVQVCPGTYGGDPASAPGSSSWADVWPAEACRAPGRSGSLRLPSRSEHVHVTVTNAGEEKIALERILLVYDQQDYYKVVNLPNLDPGQRSPRVILPVDLLDNVLAAHASCSCGLEEPVRLELIGRSDRVLRSKEGIGVSVSFLEVGRDRLDEYPIALRVKNTGDQRLAPTLSIEISPS